MPSLSQSPMLQALGYAIAHSLWQMALVWIVYVLLNSLFKFKSEIKYRIAVAAQVVGFSWFIGTLQFYYHQCSQALRVAEAFYLENADQSTIVYANSKSSLLSFFIKTEQVLPYLSVAYLVLLVFLTIRWFRAYRYTQLIRLNGLHKIDVDWKLFVTKVAGQLGIKQKVRIYLSELVQSPVTIGFLKPVILIPIASINHLSAQQLEAVILHELAHIKRHDYLLNIVLSIIDLGLFFNPFTRLITRSVSKERENSCDDWVLQYQYNPSMYAEALLRIAVMQKTPAMAMYAAKTKSELASRVQRMIHQKDGRFSYKHQLIALLLMTGILTSIAWYDPNSMKFQDTKPTAVNRAVVLEPLAAKVDNPLFNPIFFLNEPLKEEVKKNVAASEKQIHKLKKETETAMREIKLPEVMAPVAIENLKELERNLNATVNRQLRRAWYTAAPAAIKLQPGQVYPGQNQVFQFDSVKTKFANGFAFKVQDGENWIAFEEELKASQKAIEDAFRKGQITNVNAKRMQAEIIESFRRLKEMKAPQVYGFAEGNIPDAQYYFRTGDDFNYVESKKEKTKTDERKNPEQRVRVNPGVRIRKSLMDSLKKHLVARSYITMPPQIRGYLSADTSAPFLIVDDEKSTAFLNTAKIQGIRTETHARGSNKTAEASTYNYYVDSYAGEECDKANQNDKHKKCNAISKNGISPKPKTPVKGAVRTVTIKNGNTFQVLVSPPTLTEEGSPVNRIRYLLM